MELGMSTNDVVMQAARLPSVQDGRPDSPKTGYFVDDPVTGLLRKETAEERAKRKVHEAQTVQTSKEGGSHGQLDGVQHRRAIVAQPHPSSRSLF